MTESESCCCCGKFKDEIKVRIIEWFDGVIFCDVCFQKYLDEK